MDRRILLLGQFSGPLTGERTINAFVLKSLVAKKLTVSVVDTNLLSSPGDVGKMGPRKILAAIVICIRACWATANADALYITPGQTFAGLLRFLPIVLWARIRKKKVLQHWHGYGALSTFAGYPWIARQYFTCTAINIVLTFDFRSKLHNLLGPNCNIVVIKNFCDRHVIQPARERASDQVLRVLFLGSLIPEKGIDIFLDAAELLPEIHFDVCGFADGDVFSRIKALADKSVIRYHGVVEGDAKWKILENSDVFVLPTRYKTEGVPIALLDAMSAGCALVTTPLNGIPETVGAAAIFLGDSDYPDLSSILHTLDCDRFLLQEYRKRSIEQAKLYQSSRFEQELLALLDS